MIKPIKQSLNFGNNVEKSTTKALELFQNPAATKAPKQDEVDLSTKQPQPEIQTQEEKPANTFGQKIENAKIGLMNFFKGFNNVTGTTGGVVRGVIEGVIGASIVGVFGKNLKETDGKFFGTLGGVIRDVTGEAWRVVKNIPSIVTKWSPLETVTKIVKEPFRLAKKLEGNPKTIAAAAVVGLGILAFRTAQGKIGANRKNADLDHSLNEGHVPTK